MDSSVIKCTSCKFVYANLFSEKILEVNSSLGDSILGHYKAQQSVIDQAFYKSVVRCITKSMTGFNENQSKVLDVGCGHCMLLKLFKEYGWKSTGLDASPYAETAGELCGIPIVREYLEECSLPKDSFDAIVSTSTFEHVPHPRAHIKAIIDLLKPGGRALLTGMPNYNSLPIIIGLSSFRSNCPPGHVSYFTKKTLQRLIEQPEIIGKIESTRITSYGIPGAWEMYSYFLKLYRRLKYDRSKQNNGRERRETGDSNLINASMAGWADVLNYLYYLGGKPLSLGASLQLAFRKRS